MKTKNKKRENVCDVISEDASKEDNEIEMKEENTRLKKEEKRK